MLLVNLNYIFKWLEIDEIYINKTMIVLNM